LQCVVLFVLVMGGVLCAAAVSEQNYRHTRQVADRVNRSYADAAKMLDQLHELESTRAKLVEKAKQSGTLLERVPRSYLLATVTNALPGDCSLTKLEIKAVQTTVAAAAKAKSKYEAEKAALAVGAVTQSSREVVLTVTGMAGTDGEVAGFIAAMQRCPLIATADLVYSQEKKVESGDTKTTEAPVLAREFQVLMHLRADVDLRQESPPLAAATGTGTQTPLSGDKR
jgi:Tfp pilus assembly protein PilN